MLQEKGNGLWSRTALILKSSSPSTSCAMPASYVTLLSSSRHTNKMGNSSLAWRVDGRVSHSVSECVGIVAGPRDDICKASGSESNLAG